MHIARGTINQSSVLEPIDRQVGLSNQNLGALVPLLLVKPPPDQSLRLLPPGYPRQQPWLQPRQTGRQQRDRQWLVGQFRLAPRLWSHLRACLLTLLSMLRRHVSRLHMGRQVLLHCSSSHWGCSQCRCGVACVECRRARASAAPGGPPVCCTDPPLSSSRYYLQSS